MYIHVGGYKRTPEQIETWFEERGVKLQEGLYTILANRYLVIGSGMGNRHPGHPWVVTCGSQPGWVTRVMGKSGYRPVRVQAKLAPQHRIRGLSVGKY